MSTQIAEVQSPTPSSGRAGWKLLALSAILLTGVAYVGLLQGSGDELSGTGGNPRSGDRKSSAIPIKNIQVTSTGKDAESGIGYVTGRILFQSGDPEQAARWSRSGDLVVAADGGLQNVVVWVSDKRFPAAPAKPDPKLALTIVGGNFAPHVLAFHAPQMLTLANPGPQAGNFAGMGISNTFNVILPAAGVGPIIIQPESQPFIVKNDINPAMKAYVFPCAHSSFAVTGADGRFKVNSIPPGEWAFTLWHERLGYVGRQVKLAIQPGENRLEDVTVQGPAD